MTHPQISLGDRSYLDLEIDLSFHNSDHAILKARRKSLLKQPVNGLRALRLELLKESRRNSADC